MAALEYFYDAQMRRYLDQIVRAFSGFQYQTGRRDGEEPTTRTVPVRIASQNRQVAHILRNNSENTLLTVPMITVYQTALSLSRERQQAPHWIDTRRVYERSIDRTENEYSGESGNAYHVQRMVPNAMEMAVEVDVWTSNLDQKHQLAEQMLTAFTIGFDIQNSDNPLDWTALTTMYLDEVTWSSRTLPVGVNDEIDVMTLNFKLPFWLSPPARVTQLRVIEQIVANIHDSVEPKSEAESGIFGKVLARDIIAPGDHLVAVDGRTITLLGADGGELDDSNAVYSWQTLLAEYGVLKPSVSQLRLKTTEDSEDFDHDIIGTVQYDSTQANLLHWTIDPTTLPANTLPPITGVIDPLSTYPGKGLPAAANGQRYLLLHDAGPSQAWGALTAHANDIVEYQNGWSVAFQAAGAVQYVLNNASGKQLKWSGSEWIIAIDGDYHPGFWRIFLTP